MTPRSTVRRVQRALLFVEAHLFESLSAPQIAAVAGLSEGELHRHLRAVHGLSLMAYVRARRMTEAARWLEQTDELLEVALRCGYSGQASFTRAFTKHFGRPPGAYRSAGPDALHMVLPAPDDAVLDHRAALEPPTLQWRMGPTHLTGRTTQVDLSDDGGFVAAAEALRAEGQTGRAVGVVLGEMGATVPYFLGVEGAGGGPEPLTVEPGLFAVVQHRGPSHLVRHTLERAMQWLGTDLVRPSDRPSFEVIELDRLGADDFGVEVWFAVEGQPPAEASEG